MFVWKPCLLRSLGAALALLMFYVACGARADEPKAWVAKNLDDLQSLYRHLHANPELSFQEEATSARLAEELRKLGIEVSVKVGRHGVVGVFKNGAGPTLMIRTDL